MGKTVEKSIKVAPDTDHMAELIKLIRNLSQKYGVWRVFEDFVGMYAIAISNAVDWAHRDERESAYMKIVAQYDNADVGLFPQMMLHLVGEMERNADDPVDVLGVVFHNLELHNKYKGQFFTPQSVCDMMGMMAIGENGLDVEKKGFVSICEPCCGSGAIVLGFAKAVAKSGYDFQKHMVVTAMDVDLKCVHMCYLQLSLYGIPAVVVHGNSLTMQEYSQWYTPIYVLDGWRMKLDGWRMKRALRKAKEIIAPRDTSVESTDDAIANDLPNVYEQIRLDLGNPTTIAPEKIKAIRKKTTSATYVNTEQLSLF